MNNTTLQTTAAPVWGPSACSRERFGIAPIVPQHGSAMSTVGYADVSFAGYGAKATAALATDKQAVAMTTLAAVRHDDVRVPDPRERKR